MEAVYLMKEETQTLYMDIVEEYYNLFCAKHSYTADYDYFKTSVSKRILTMYDEDGELIYLGFLDIKDDIDYRCDKTWIKEWLNGLELDESLPYSMFRKRKDKEYKQGFGRGFND